MDAVTVRWAWGFVDAPAATFDATLEFWRRVTRTTLSPRRGAQGQFVTLVPEAGDAWLKAQRLDDGPPRVHLDLDVSEPLSLARDRAVALGARVLDEQDDVVVCASPGGLAFCLTRWHPEETAAGQHREGEASLVDQVCLDIPSSRYDSERPPERDLGDPPAEVRRHLALGAEHVARGCGWTVLRDPSGTEYCVTDRRP